MFASQLWIQDAELPELNQYFFCQLQSMQEHCCQQADTAVPHHTAWLSHLGAGEHLCSLSWQPGHEEIEFGFETEIIAIFNPRVLIC